MTHVIFYCYTNSRNQKVQEQLFKSRKVHSVDELCLEYLKRCLCHRIVVRVAGILQSNCLMLMMLIHIPGQYLDDFFRFHKGSTCFLKFVENVLLFLGMVDSPHVLCIILLALIFTVQLSVAYPSSLDD